MLWMQQIDLIPVRRVLISVSDKTGLLDVACALVKEFSVELISTGGTSRSLQSAGLNVSDVADLTGFPEMMDGRVKTLHPKIHGGLLAARDNPQHVQTMQEHGIVPIDLLIVNLYPFEQATSKPDCMFEHAIENIDIGGPAMIRSAAKNHRSVVVITDPSQYAQLLENLRKNRGSTDLSFRFEMAAAAFSHTARYDAAIASYLAGCQDNSEAGRESIDRGLIPLRIELLDRIQVLRYGENPHQAAALYSNTPIPTGLCAARQLHGKALSYMNLLDADAGLALVQEFDQPAAAIIKHANPCGCATADSLSMAFDLAYAGDPVAAFGGILALNRHLDTATAEKIVGGKRFIEVILAPEYEPKALELLLQRWADCRILLTSPQDQGKEELNIRSIAGGMLIQQTDQSGFERSECHVASERQPTTREWIDMQFAWLVCKHVKSNAITLAAGQQLLSAGAGQMSRVTSCRLAVELAQRNGHAQKLVGAAAASDAFFPFPDGPEILIDAGTSAIIQPGGSKKDDETIKLCNTRSVALVFTGRRHFRH
jgi:phosphoribosylaminoimidazolecarboxamide formyltransferase / IMP cyclohydrolase